MTDLRRTRVGDFKIEDAKDISIDSLISIKDILNCKKIELTPDIEKKVLNGALIDNIYNADEVLFIKNNTEIALYRKELDKLKPYKMFKGGIL